MLCPPTMRPASPAESEISVGGAPSPLPAQHPHQHQHLHHPRGGHHIDLLQQQQLLMQQHAAAVAASAAAAAAAGLTRPEDYFQPLKRLRMSSSSSEPREQTPSPPPPPPPAQPATAQQPSNNNSSSGSTKSAIEGVKSFSIADILGHHSAEKQRSASVSPPPATALLAPPAARPVLQPRSEPLEMHPAAAAAMLLPGGQIVRPWDHLLGPMPVRPFIPSALLHYEQRLALDYHRQLQEHFNAQAQLLRHMGMDIIPSESGSDRSSSAASDCCSPEIVRDSAAAAAAAAAASAAGGAGAAQSSAQAERERHPSSGSSPSQAQGGSSSSSNAAAVAAAEAKAKANGTPLDALFQMTTKDFDESQDKSHLDIFSNRPQPKKKRKSRTAFTNHQIFELEKRFLYQKYLSPADRDEIAASLGLSNAQVITWFQNRRAKQKRDIEELKKDFDSVKVFSAHKSFLENVNDLSILKKKPMHEADMVGLAAAAAAAGMVGVPGVPVPVPVSAAQALGTPPK